MAKFIIKRLLQAIPLLLVISFIVFSLIYISPYNVIDALGSSVTSEEQLDLLRMKYGLDQPFFVQYVAWLKNILSGDFGYSMLTQTSIGVELARRVPNTMLLVIPSYFTALLIATSLGLLAASKKGKWVDKIIQGVISFGIATPTFWFAMVLIYVLGYQLNVFPIIGMHTVGKEGDVLDFLSHFMLPYFTLTVNFFPRLTRYVRASATTQLDEDYVVVQQAFGASKFEIFSKHIFRNVLIPIVTQIGLALPMMVTGAIITETIFAWPGVGPYLMTATKSLDYPIIMAVMLLSATLVILGNLLSDILYSIVDPRIRENEGR